MVYSYAADYRSLASHFLMPTTRGQRFEAIAGMVLSCKLWAVKWWLFDVAWGPKTVEVRQTLQFLSFQTRSEKQFLRGQVRC